MFPATLGSLGFHRALLSWFFPILIGTPQRSVLILLLFSLYASPRVVSYIPEISATTHTMIDIQSLSLVQTFLCSFGSALPVFRWISLLGVSLAPQTCITQNSTSNSHQTCSFLSPTYVFPISAPPSTPLLKPETQESFLSSLAFLHLQFVIKFHLFIF